MHQQNNILSYNRNRDFIIIYILDELNSQNKYAERKVKEIFNKIFIHFLNDELKIKLQSHCHVIGGAALHLLSSFF